MERRRSVKSDTLLNSHLLIMSEHYYIAVKASLHASDTSVFGLEPVEVTALFERFPGSSKDIINGVLIKGTPFQVINLLSELGYKVVCSSGEAEIVWTLCREILLKEQVAGGLVREIQDKRSQVAPLKEQKSNATHSRQGQLRRDAEHRLRVEPERVSGSKGKIGSLGQQSGPGWTAL
ncbi:uncharacterized protein LOC142319718 isoform X2 [Lycorma delicatula]|uniref:uncharacterized protein LOC142319718 isoform X2 n=1 Tax=Lycorma delicatula TaxID=130591 RepID=UPI003F50EFC2